MPCLVVTTDLSAAARTALEPALRLARALACDLRLLHVVPSPVLAPALAGSPELDRREAERALAEVCASLRGDVPVHGDVRLAENVLAGVDAYAREHAASYVVTAASGKSGWQRLRLGSVCGALVHHARLPVVVVPSQADSPGPGFGAAVAVATDGSAAAGRAVALGAELARALGVAIVLVGVAPAGPAVESRRRDLEQATAPLRARGLAASSVVLAGTDVARLISEWAAKNAGYVCMAPAQAGLRRLLFGSTVDALLQHLTVPGVVVPPPAG